MDTSARVIAHSDAVDPADIRSTSRATHDTRPLARDYEGKPAVGPRAARAHAAALAAASVRPVPAADAPSFETAARAAFVRHDDAAYTDQKGRRVMKTTDGVELVRARFCVVVVVVGL